MRRASAFLFVIVSILIPVIAQIPGNAPIQSTSQSTGQSNCSLINPPAIRGIRLGMTTEEVFALFPGASERLENKTAIAAAAEAPHYGVAGLYFNRLSYPSSARENFAGIDSISITLFDGHVAELRIEYAGPNSQPRGAGWNHVDDFIAKLSEAFGLPEPKYWLDTASSQKSVKCSAFEIHATNSAGQGSVSLHKVGYRETLRQRAMADEEKRRREFKP